MRQGVASCVLLLRNVLSYFQVSPMKKVVHLRHLLWSANTTLSDLLQDSCIGLQAIQRRHCALYMYVGGVHRLPKYRVEGERRGYILKLCILGGSCG